MSSTIRCIIGYHMQIALAQEAVVLQTSEASLHMPCHAGGDSASVSSGELAVTVVSAAPALKGDNPKVMITLLSKWPTSGQRLLLSVTYRAGLMVMPKKQWCDKKNHMCICDIGFIKRVGEKERVSLCM